MQQIIDYDKMPRLATFPEYAAIKGVTNSTVYKWAKENRIVTLRDNGKILVDVKASEPKKENASQGKKTKAPSPLFFLERHLHKSEQWGEMFNKSRKKWQFASLILLCLFLSTLLIAILVNVELNVVQNDNKDLYAEQFILSEKLHKVETSLGELTTQSQRLQVENDHLVSENVRVISQNKMLASTFGTLIDIIPEAIAKELNWEVPVKIATAEPKEQGLDFAERLKEKLASVRDFDQYMSALVNIELDLPENDKGQLHIERFEVAEKPPQAEAAEIQVASENVESESPAKLVTIEVGPVIEAPKGVSKDIPVETVAVEVAKEVPVEAVLPATEEELSGFAEELKRKIASFSALDQARVEAIAMGNIPRHMTRDELIAALGPPDRLSRDDGYDQYLYYDRRPGRFWFKVTSLYCFRQ